MCLNFYLANSYDVQDNMKDGQWNWREFLILK